ncbi:MAG: hypothetical protein K5769_07865 [Pseudobutyrivibrio sp.]|nr:hypothetical protein [Pseudobutyrivibrio sp.]
MLCDIELLAFALSLRDSALDCEVDSDCFALSEIDSLRAADWLSEAFSLIATESDIDSDCETTSLNLPERDVTSLLAS